MRIKTSKYSVNYTENTLYTKGGEFTIETTGEEYVGPYHVQDGVPYTGKPKSVGSLRMLPYTYDRFSTYVYDKRFKFANPAKLHKQPTYYRPNPGQSEYKLGYFYRYIVTHNLDKTKFPIEITVGQANTFGSKMGIDGGLYTLHKIKWTIVGSLTDIETQGGTIPSIENANRAAVHPLVRQYPMMEFAFRNYTEFARPTFF